MARPRPKIAAALKDQLSVAVNNGLVPFVGFGVSVPNQRAAVSVLAHVCVNRRIVCGAIPILSAGSECAVLLFNRAKR